MILQDATFYNDDPSTSKVPFFDGTDYAYWKAMMQIWLIALDFDVWSVIENGPHVPMRTLGDKTIVKDVREYDATDKKLVSLNAKAMNCLYFALDRNEFNRISSCSDTKEI